MKRLKFLRNFHLAALSLLTATMFSSCGWLHEESDCDEASCIFTFTYDMNLKFADAFAAEVKEVTVLMFDTDGTLRYHWRVPKSDMVDGNSLRVDVEPGVYDVLTWAGEYMRSADVNEGERGESQIEEYHCRVRRMPQGIIDTHIESIYHALDRVELSENTFNQPTRHTFNLTKDTNSVRIVLQQLSGDPVNLDDLDITITDANGWLNHDNSLRPDELLTYQPWFSRSGTVDITRGALGALTTEFTVSRLMADRDPMVTVTRKDGTPVFSVSLVDYALLVKGNYHREMSDQEYLDRQDEYNMTFFLDENLRWISSQIIINDWVIVDNDVETE